MAFREDRVFEIREDPRLWLGGEGLRSIERLSQVRPHCHDGHGEAWRLLTANHDEIKAWVDADQTGCGSTSC